VKISDLKRRVQIQQRTRQPDGGGGFDGGWQTVYTLAAQITQNDGSLAFRYGRIEALAPWVVTIRYSQAQSIDTNMQILYGTHKLVIKSVVNVGDANRWLRISCEEVR
jgi:head-tail adaptor